MRDQPIPPAMLRQAFTVEEGRTVELIVRGRDGRREAVLFSGGAGTYLPPMHVPDVAEVGFDD